MGKMVKGSRLLNDHTLHTDIPSGLNPNCLQATRALRDPQKSSQTVPQILLLQISTRPLVALPPRSLMLAPSHGIYTGKSISVEKEILN